MRASLRARTAAVAPGVAALLAAFGACHLDDLLGTRDGPGGSDPPPDDSTATVPTPGAATRLAFRVPPTNVRAGEPIAPAIEVIALDRDGEAVDDFTGGVMLALDANPGDATLGGTTERTAVAGVARFADLSLERIGRGYSVRASGSGLATVVSDPFDVLPGDAATLTLAAGDGQADTIDATLGDPYVVRVTDPAAQPVAGVAIRWSVTGGGGGIIAQSETDATGHAQATHVLGSSVGPQTATASADGLAGSPITFTATAQPGAPHRLAFVGQPSDAEAGEVIAPPVEVAVRDREGHRVAGFDGAVDVRLGANPGNARLGGTTTRLADAGVAHFPDLLVDRPGGGYTLRADAEGLPEETSAAFDVAGGDAGAAALVRLGGNAQTDTIGATLAPFVVRVTDAEGDAVAGVTVRWTVTGGGGTISPSTSVTDETGHAQAVRVLGTTSGTYTAEASVDGLPGSPATFTATALPGTPVSITFTQQPQNTPAGAAITPPVRVTLHDRAGNVATTFGGSITMSITPSTGTIGATLSGTRTRTVASGTAAFDDLRIDLVGVGYRLRATGGGLATDSAPFDVLL